MIRIKWKIFLLKITTENISKNKTQKLYNNLIKPDADVLKKSKGKNKNIRSNILNVLKNIESSVFEGYYFNYKNLPEESNETDIPELESEESVAQGINIIRKGLKILTPNQMLSTLPISFLDNFYILCTGQKNLQSKSIKVWSTLYKNGNNLYEHWKQ